MAIRIVYEWKRIHIGMENVSFLSGKGYIFGALGRFLGIAELHNSGRAVENRLTISQLPLHTKNSRKSRRRFCGAFFASFERVAGANIRQGMP